MMRAVLHGGWWVAVFLTAAGTPEPAVGTAAPAAPGPPEAHLIAPGVLSTPANEFGGSVTPDGSEIYYSISVPLSYRYVIFRSRRTGDHWGPPDVAPFSGFGRDFDPVVAPDGKSIVFISDRPVAPNQPKHDYDAWIVDRTPDGWGAPRNLGPPINRTGPDGETNEDFASLTADGTLYFAGDAPEGGMAIFRAHQVGGHYRTPEKLSANINAGPLTGEPIVAPDGRFMLFAAYGRPEGFGGWDVYISSHLADDTWAPGENLGPAVNTPQRDYSPRLMPDGHTLIFTSERYFATGRATPVDWQTLRDGLASIPDGDGNLYEIDLRSLGLKSLATE